MNCQQLQSSLSFYLYGELDFATEDGVEEHLAVCAFCQLALQREKSWHASLHSESESVPLELLSECRQNLRAEIGKQTETEWEAPRQRFSFANVWDRILPIGSGSVFGSWVRSPWPARLAAASFLLLAGFYMGRIGDQQSPFSNAQLAGPAQAGVLQPYLHVRDIQPDADGRIRMVVDKGESRQLLGVPSDYQIRHYLLIAARSAVDPAVRFDSVEMLAGQPNTDVRNALIASARQDPNAAVRVKALQGLRPFLEDSETQKTVMDVLHHDENPSVRSAAIDILAPTQSRQIRDREVIGLMQQLLEAHPSVEEASTY